MIVSCGIALKDESWDSSSRILGPGGKVYAVTRIYWPVEQRPIDLPSGKGHENCILAVAKSIRGKFFATTDNMELDYLVADWPMFDTLDECMQFILMMEAVHAT